MKTLTDFIIGFMAIEHIWIMVLEMFLWTHRIGLKTFGLNAELAQSTRILAANQGLYNGFLVAGLGWGLIDGSWPIKFFFVACVLVAGIFGGLTAKRSILVVQALPALLAASLLLITH